MTTGETIRRIRISIGMTQADLGALLHFTQPAISQLEHDGPASYDLRVLRRVAIALQVPLAILAAESDEEASTSSSSDTKALEELNKASGDEYVEQSKKLKDETAIEGPPPPKDNKPAGGGDDGETIG